VDAVICDRGHDLYDDLFTLPKPVLIDPIHLFVLSKKPNWKRVTKSAASSSSA
jgi:hypothetical protein